MSVDEKNQYKSESKQKKPSVPQQGIKNKSTCVTLQDVERLKNEAADEKRKMDLTIEQLLLIAMEENRLEKQHFFFINISYFLKRINGAIWPCELAMAEFCIQDGVVDTMHIVKTILALKSQIIKPFSIR